MQFVTRATITSIVILFVLYGKGNPLMAESSQSNDATEWQREKRVQVYNSVRRARYPSIIKSADGALMVLFTRQTEDQENAQRGDLVLVRSTDAGQSWSEDQVVFEAKLGEPRAVGTMTRLADDRIIAPFAELSEDLTKSIVRILHRDANANDWQVSDVRADCPFVWWAPCGQVLETDNGDLVMPVFGATSTQRLEGTIHDTGLLRSADGGVTWGEFRPIAIGGTAVIGAAPTTRFSFQGVSVVPLTESPGRPWLATVTARRLNKAGTGPTVVDEGPGAPQIVCRLWSTDEGRTWTHPDQLTPGGWPCAASVGGSTVLASTSWSGWGDIRLIVSRDGLKSFHQMLPMMTLGWTRGRKDKPQEAPLPPTVPYLGEQWPYEHYGFPSIVALDQDNMMAVFGRPQRGDSQIDGPETLEIPASRERIQAVFYRRRSADIGRSPASATEMCRPRGRWVLMDRITVEDFGPCAQTTEGDLIGYVRGKIRRSHDGGRTWSEIPGAALPDDDPKALRALGVLRSGRWLAAYVEEATEYVLGTRELVGSVGGYPTFRVRGHVYDAAIVVHYSDDEGQTWEAGDPLKGPFRWAVPAMGLFIESPDGSVAMPIFGNETAEEDDSNSLSNGVIRSHDGGQTWGNFSFAFRTNPKGPHDYQPEPQYSELNIVQLSNGHWVANSYNPRIGMGPAGWGANPVAVSTDLGRRWHTTGASLAGFSHQAGVALPDGGIAFISKSTSWQAPGVAISYDEGHTFSYMLSGPYETINAFAHGPDEFLVFTKKHPRSDMAAGVYRWLPEKEK